MGAGYAPLYLTWSLTRSSSSSVPTPAQQASACPSIVDLRRRVQTARVGRHLSVADLAAHVRSDAETLAAFERGDGVLSPELLARVCHVLRVT